MSIYPLQAKTVAEQLAAKLNTRLNYQPRDESANEPAEEVFRKYETELEINDFPQQARWRVTSKVISTLNTAPTCLAAEDVDRRLLNVHPLASTWHRRDTRCALLPTR